MKIQFAIDEYKSQYVADGGLADELYKWKLITDQYRKPDPDAENLAEELRAMKYFNLVYGPQYYDVVAYAEEASGVVGGALRLLFDESRPLQERVDGFKSAVDSCWEVIKDKYPERKKKACDERLTSFFLTMHDPDTYTFYKNDLYLYLCKLTGEKKKSTGKKLVHYYEMLNKYILPKIREDAEFVNAIDAELDKLGYRKSDLLVAQTVLWMTMPQSDRAEVSPDLDTLSEPADDAKYWWLVAAPKFFTFADKPVGTKERWTLRNENGHKRKVFKDLESAREGDIVVCYDANPTKQIVALAVVSRASDGETIEFQKTETLLYPIDWAEIKSNPDLAEMKFVKNQMAMTFCSLTDDEADTIMGMIRERNTKEAPKAQAYTKCDFLSEVFMAEEEYDRLLSLLHRKKNIILQGAPGVGKTFTAKRLAYSIIGREDESKVGIIQFHQNYSYEDFFMGYKPNDDGGFDLKNGLFYEFCKRAARDRGNKYFFIIDEINRGNLSKIFGELLMLVENDYRDKDIRLAYRNEDFSVPTNLYIIGMMNTADRSLAMIDYALRRRFSFFDIKPGFDSDGFKKMQAQIGDEKFDKVVEAVKSLNRSIEADDSLGAGFCIGHSYFCLPDNEEYSDMWLRNIIDYDIEPMLREYWFDNREKCQDEISKIKSLLK